MVAVWPVLPQWSRLGGGTDGGCVAGVTTVVTIRRRDRWWLYGQCYHSGHTYEDGQVVAVWPVLPQWSHLGGGTGGGYMASATTVVKIRRRDRW